MTGKLHKATGTVRASGAVRVLCGDYINNPKALVEDLAQVPAGKRCKRCWGSSTGGPAVRLDRIKDLCLKQRTNPLAVQILELLEA